MTIRHSRFPTLCVLLLLSAQSFAQIDSPDIQIARAVLPAPDEFQAGAGVLGYDATGSLVELRVPSNDLVCVADDPEDDQFHVACYHRTLEDFMSRGRQLRADGKERDEVQAIRKKEISAGTLAFPDGPALLYSLSGPPESLGDDNDTSDLSALQVVYLAYATPETTGLSATPKSGAPWLMNGGEPWAHIMIYHPAGEEE